MSSTVDLYTLEITNKTAHPNTNQINIARTQGLWILPSRRRMDFLFFLSLISLLHAGCLVPLMCFYSGQMIESCTGGQRFILELKRLMSLLYWRTSILPVEISPTHKKFTEITSRFRCFILNPSLMSVNAVIKKSKTNSTLTHSILKYIQWPNHRSLQSPHLYVLISSLSVPSKLQHYYGCDHNDSQDEQEQAEPHHHRECGGEIKPLPCFPQSPPVRNPPLSVCRAGG